MQNTNEAKIMVNFKLQKVVHTLYPTDHEKFHALIMDGYQYGGDVKVKKDNIFLFWKPKFFSPKHKYQRSPEEIAAYNEAQKNYPLPMKKSIVESPVEIEEQALDLPASLRYVFTYFQKTNPEKMVTHPICDWTFEEFYTGVESVYPYASAHTEEIREFWKNVNQAAL